MTKHWASLVPSGSCLGTLTREETVLWNFEISIVLRLSWDKVRPNGIIQVGKPSMMFGDELGGK